MGEAFWSPRLYEYTAMIAPKGREGTYMALASAPNFAAKLAVGGISGSLLATFCPSEGHCNGRSMWLAVALMTITSPVLMLLLRQFIEPDDVSEDSHRAQLEQAEEEHEREGLLERDRAEGTSRPTAAITSAGVTQRSHGLRADDAEC